MDLATRWSSLFVGMSPASFINFSFLPKYGVYFLQALGYTLLLAVVSLHWQFFRRCCWRSCV